ncbi:hypothetical protein ACE5IS_00190 [Leptospira wolffii]|uniref:Uncharacterized protein n=1 Tax=Leptospira wolffii TaxID=409998 RepID=A0ABV5BJ03_9LEPT|nr:hypothetical protein [Leptospira wolffii]TGL49014.1 hypothetical protein EHQ61_11060 [Leptospira wolffii]
MNAAKSVQYFGVFLVIEGILLIAIPDLFLGVILLNALDVWVRILGVALAILGYFYFEMGRQNVRSFLRLTTHSRTFQFLTISVFVLLGWIHPMIFLPSGFEFLCGVLTFVLLKRES